MRHASRILPAGLVLLGLGMVLVIGGVSVPALFFPGVYTVGLAFLVSLAGGVMLAFSAESP